MVFNYFAELFYIFFPKLLWMAQLIFFPLWAAETLSNSLGIAWLTTLIWFLSVAGLFLLGCVFIGQVILFIKHRGAWQLLSKKTFAILLACTTLISSATYVAMDSLQYETQNYSVFTEFFWIVWILFLSLAVLGMGSLVVHTLAFLKWLSAKYLSKVSVKIPPIISRSIFLLFVLYPIVSLLTLLIWFFADPIPNISGSRFFTINAAIKNTCFIDPKRDHCPHTLEEISYIEPAAYRAMLQDSQVQYNYYPETNTYTLVVRYSPVQAVVFDPRLTASIGVDFKEFDVSLVGTDHLVNPPDFAGPWEFPNWWKY